MTNPFLFSFFGRFPEQGDQPLPTSVLRSLSRFLVYWGKFWHPLSWHTQWSPNICVFDSEHSALQGRAEALPSDALGSSEEGIAKTAGFPRRPHACHREKCCLRLCSVFPVVVGESGAKHGEVSIRFWFMLGHMVLCVWEVRIFILKIALLGCNSHTAQFPL